MDLNKLNLGEAEIFRQIADHSHLGIWVLNPQGLVVYFNEAAVKIWAGSLFAGPESYGDFKAWDIETGKQLASEDWGAWKVMMNDETVIDQLLRIERFDGEMGMILNSAIPIKDEKGKLTAILVMNHDVTELKASEARQEEIVRIVSHDLKNPLHAILMSSQLLQQKVEMLVSTGNIKKLHHYAGIITSSATVCMGIVKDILDMAKLEKGPFEVESSQFLASALLNSLRPIYDPLADYRNIALNWEISPAIEIYGDRERIFQVISNIVGNAIKFTPDSGKISVMCSENEKEVLFQVSDTGPGIQCEHLKKIFQKNYQVQEKPTSTGLGLYIAEMIISAHGGKIWVESHPGQGSKFFFTLPRK
ncbi:MAG: PAS domain-containing sensor histidine kinase [Bdellovibrionota bacterium]